MAAHPAGPTRLTQPPPVDVEIATCTIHGYRRVYRLAGSGPPLLLIHGIGDSSETWQDIIPALARNHLVIAPDLLGHGRSAKPRADYSVAAYANGMRDLLGVLGIDTVTLVGHSLGGGVAMQFAYQFPERTERLVLVASGGLGRSVSPVLQAATLPGANLALSTLRLPGARTVVSCGLALLKRLDNGLGIDATDLRRLIDALPDATTRAAFIRTLRAVVDWRGQVVTMLDRCYLVAGMPTLLAWGSRDSVLPVTHAHIAHAAMPRSQLEIFDGAGHFPFRSDPSRFVRVLETFIDNTQPCDWSSEDWRQLLRQGNPTPTPGTPSGTGAAQRAASERSAT
jgi:pimeloyl-ACP methyl ester carboxylesterase